MDDEEMIREIVKMMLEEFGYQVECTDNGSTVVELYQQRRAEGIPFAVVILDLTIPGGMGGQEVITALLQIDPEVKAIAASGYSSAPVMANYREYGFNGVLAKPFGLQEVSDVLRDLLVTDADVK
jgi:CheY-like chemotaxis protein